MSVVFCITGRGDSEGSLRSRLVLTVHEDCIASMRDGTIKVLEIWRARQNEAFHPSSNS